MKAGNGGFKTTGWIVQQKVYRRWPARAQVRVKWWSKRPPRLGQPRRHGKPHAVQDRTGEGWPARSSPGISRTPRKRGAPLRRGERNDRTVPRERDGQNPAYRGAALSFPPGLAQPAPNRPGAFQVGPGRPARVPMAGARTPRFPNPPFPQPAHRRIGGHFSVRVAAGYR